MDIKTKAKIVTEAWDATRDPNNGKQPFEQWKSVHHYLDLGFPLAFAFDNGYITLTKKGEAIVDEAYKVIATALTLDLTKEYESFEEMLDDNLEANKES